MEGLAPVVTAVQQYPAVAVELIFFLAGCLSMAAARRNQSLKVTGLVLFIIAEVLAVGMILANVRQDRVTIVDVIVGLVAAAAAVLMGNYLGHRLNTAGRFSISPDNVS